MVERRKVQSLSEYAKTQPEFRRTRIIRLINESLIPGKSQGKGPGKKYLVYNEELDVLIVANPELRDYFTGKINRIEPIRRLLGKAETEPTPPPPPTPPTPTASTSKKMAASGAVWEAIGKTIAIHPRVQAALKAGRNPEDVIRGGRGMMSHQEAWLELGMVLSLYPIIEKAMKGKKDVEAAVTECLTS